MLYIHFDKLDFVITDMPCRTRIQLLLTIRFSNKCFRNYQNNFIIILIVFFSLRTFCLKMTNILTYETPILFLFIMSRFPWRCVLLLLKLVAYKFVMLLCELSVKRRLLGQFSFFFLFSQTSSTANNDGEVLMHNSFDLYVKYVIT